MGVELQKLLQPVRYLKGVGPQREKQLNRLAIHDLYDLVWHIPRSYIDRTDTISIGDLQAGEVFSVRGQIRTVKISYSARGIAMIRAEVFDDTGTVQAIWFNQMFLKKFLKIGSNIYLRGKISSYPGKMEMAVYDYEIIDEGDMAISSGIDPVYPSTEGLSQKAWRVMMKQALDVTATSYPEVLPAGLREQLDLVPASIALQRIHFPTDVQDREQARRSLAMEELFMLQMAIRREQSSIGASDIRGIRNLEQDDLVETVKAGFGFDLTASQERVLKEVFDDMESERPMNRLVQGDVGSGKTAVAAMAIAKAVSSGNQVAFMAPTEILAQQHYAFLSRVFPSIVRIELLTGTTSSRQKNRIRSDVAEGKLDIIIGTHALIQESVGFDRLSLVVIDEQHRFGVSQRALLGQKGEWPDILVMSATPIPRTLALTLYGDLDVSTIDQMPEGRKPIKTLALRSTSREKTYRFLLNQVKAGRQGYVVCPLIEESEKQDLMDATALYKWLQENIFSSYRVGLLHGRMKPAEKDQIIEEFRQGQIDVLVCTTVVEVGVDVANASMMVIEGSERFGLSQLHQLRGRVGRGSDQAFCVLLGDPRTHEGRERMKVLERTTDGFEIAREDLRLRGSGDLWGLKQHGMPELKLTDLWKDVDLMEISRESAARCAVEHLQDNQVIATLLNKKFASGNIAAN